MIREGLLQFGKLRLDLLRDPDFRYRRLYGAPINLHLSNQPAMCSRRSIGVKDRQSATVRASVADWEHRCWKENSRLAFQH